jgi:branched-chain amino acid aminotransferase
MSKQFFYNGQFLNENKPIVGAGNRGLRYGDGLFETTKWANGEIALKEYHFERFFRGLALLKFELPGFFTPEWMEKNIKALCEKNQEKVARVRLSVFRGNGGLYDPENHFPNCIIQTWPLPGAASRLNENGLVTGIYRLAKKSQDTFANLKHNNYLPYVMAALHAKEQHWNDALVLNNSGNICDATIANIFLVKNGAIFTPSLEEGCVAGVMRKWLIQQLPAAGYKVTEKEITVDELLYADEVFLTNAIYGIRWVQSCEQKRFTNLVTGDIYRKMIEGKP